MISKGLNTALTLLVEPARRVDNLLHLSRNQATMASKGLHTALTLRVEPARRVDSLLHLSRN